LLFAFKIYVIIDHFKNGYVDFADSIQNLRIFFAQKTVEK